MEAFIYFGVSVLAGMITALGCALKKLLGDNKDQLNFPDAEVLNDDVTKKRVVWLFVWVLQGIVGGFIVSLLFADSVFNGTTNQGWVWALAFASGSVSWLNFKASLSAIKDLISGFLK
ncbi:hypothetical protein [Vibrio sp. NH-UV-68]|uniref:hypothetical protein n=2 Tax=Vibrio TaxID=662 RepID=UPI000A5C8DD3